MTKLSLICQKARKGNKIEQEKLEKLEIEKLKLEKLEIEKLKLEKTEKKTNKIVEINEIDEIDEIKENNEIRTTTKISNQQNNEKRTTTTKQNEGRKINQNIKANQPIFLNKNPNHQTPISLNTINETEIISLSPNQTNITLANGTGIIDKNITSQLLNNTQQITNIKNNEKRTYATTKKATPISSSISSLNKATPISLNNTINETEIISLNPNQTNIKLVNGTEIIDTSTKFLNKTQQETIPNFK
jgi:hypothetical protein